MKLLVALFLAVAVNSALSSQAEEEGVKPNNPRSVNTIFNVTITDTRPKLPDGYNIIFENNEYVTAIKFHRTEKTWNEARRTCFHEGGFLTYATSKAEDTLYHNWMIENNQYNLWIGIHDFYGEDDFVTVLGEDAKEVAYIDWYPGEPNSAGGITEKCIHYIRGRGDKIGWNDNYCDKYYPFCCKIKVAKILQTKLC